MINKDRLKGFLKSDAYSIEVLGSTDSTNAYLKRQALKGGEAAIALTQTGGRGRLGRSWCSPEGNIYMSFCVKTDFAKAQLCSLAAAVAVKQALEPTECKIKWPNDIVLSGRKLCGILSEAVTRGNEVFCIVGIGINIKTAEFGEKLINPAIALCEATENIDADKICADVLNNFELLMSDTEKMLSLYREDCVNIGKTVKIISGDGEYTANAVGIGENGNLIIEKDNEIKFINSGEVSVRGIYGYCD